MSTDLTIRRIRDRDADAAGYTHVIEPAFPPAELVGADEYLRLFREGVMDVWHAEAAGETVGCAVIMHVDGHRHRLLGYLAVAATAQSGGVGGRLLARVIAEHRDVVDHLYAEIENPDRVPEEEKADAERRHRFYRRYDTRVLDVDYLTPGAPGEPSLTILDLCVIPTDPDRGEPVVVRMAELLEVLVALRERAGEGFDDRWAAMVAGAIRAGDGHEAGIRHL